MKGLWLENNQPIVYTELPTPELFVVKTLIKVLQAGICNTD